ncbi:MAG: peptide deformylase [Deltaproteobacteria bacterium]|nr:peptide deformylase [Deltaproteobacteria bacterium]
MSKLDPRRSRAVPPPLPRSAQTTRAVPPAPPVSGTYRRIPLRPIARRPAAILLERAREIDPRAPGVLAIAEALVTTLRAANGSSLTGPQIGESVRMLVMDVTGHPRARSSAGLVVMVNPRIVERDGWVEWVETCASVPTLMGEVWRNARVTVEGFEPGTTRILRIEADAVEARCLQHAIDHLDGYSFMERTEKRFVRSTYAGTTPQPRCGD